MLCWDDFCLWCWEDRYSGEVYSGEVCNSDVRWSEMGCGIEYVVLLVRREIFGK